MYSNIRPGLTMAYDVVLLMYNAVKEEIQIQVSDLGNVCTLELFYLLYTKGFSKPYSGSSILAQTIEDTELFSIP